MLQHDDHAAMFFFVFFTWRLRGQRTRTAFYER